MADVELVVKVPEELLDKLDDENYQNVIYWYNTTLYRAIKDGIVLPKEHGRIGDLDSVMNDINNDINEMTNIGIMVDGEYLWGKLNDAIYNAHTLIESNMESKE